MYKSVAILALLCTSQVLSLPLDILGGDSTNVAGGVTPPSSIGASGSPVIGGSKKGNILDILQILPLKNGTNGLVGDIINVVRLLVSQDRLIINALIPSLDSTLLSQLEELLSKPNMTSSDILEQLDRFIADTDNIKLTKLYEAIQQDVEGKVNDVLTFLEKALGTLLPGTAPLIAELKKVVMDKTIPLLRKDQIIGELLIKIFEPLDKILGPFLNELSLLNVLNLINLNSGLLGGLGELLQKVLILVGNLINQLLGGTGLLGGLLGKDGLLSGDGLLGGLLGEDGLVGALLGDDGLVGGLLGDNGLVGGLLGGDGLVGGLLKL